MKILEIKRSDLSASKISIDEKNVTCRLNKETITFHFRYSLNGRSSIILGEFDKDNWSSENAIEIVAKYNDYKKQVKSGVDIKNILVQEKKEAERELYRWTLADACTNHIKEDMRGDHATRRNYTTIIYKHILGLKKKKIKGFE